MWVLAKAACLLSEAKSDTHRRTRSSSSASSRRCVCSFQLFRLLDPFFGVCDLVTILIVLGPVTICFCRPDSSCSVGREKACRNGSETADSTCTMLTSFVDLEATIRHVQIILPATKNDAPNKDSSQHIVLVCPVYGKHCAFSSSNTSCCSTSPELPSKWERGLSKTLAAHDARGSAIFGTGLAYQ